MLETLRAPILGVKTVVASVHLKYWIRLLMLQPAILGGVAFLGGNNKHGIAPVVRI